jgi:hypothetical protein
MIILDKSVKMPVWLFVKCHYKLAKFVRFLDNPKSPCYKIKANIVMQLCALCRIITVGRSISVGFVRIVNKLVSGLRFTEISRGLCSKLRPAVHILNCPCNRKTRIRGRL